MKAHFQPQAPVAGAPVTSVLLFLDAITWELPITSKTNCFSPAIAVGHLMIEAELTECSREVFGLVAHIL